jgi:hypothetical protein
LVYLNIIFEEGLKMKRKIIFILSFMGFIACLFSIGNTVNKYHNDINAIHEQVDSCKNLQNQLNHNAEEFNNLPDYDIDLKNAIITEHNRQVAQFEVLCS